jgi:hypothetical protein
MPNYDHNGKEVKKQATQNVAIPKKSYHKLRSFAYSKGWRIGWFFEQAAIEKMENEIQKEKK